MSNCRVQKNLEVLKFLSDYNNNQDISEIKKILNSYTGWGGLRSAIYTPSVYKQLKQHLTDLEIDSIKQTTNSAYYTPELLVTFMWSMLLKHMTFQGGDVLETSVGHGVFLDYMPHSISSKCNIEAIEMDLLTCRILLAKYPNLKLTCSPFENIYFGNKKYDLIISNPPYGSQIVRDISNSDLSHLAIHHFFIAKSARLLKDNGVIAMVLPSYFLDNIRDHARGIITASGLLFLVHKAYLLLPPYCHINLKITYIYNQATKDLLALKLTILFLATLASAILFL